MCNKMHKFVLLSLLVGVAFAQHPRPPKPPHERRECVAPNYFSAKLIVYDFVTKFYHMGKVFYDAMGEKVRLFEEHTAGHKGSRDTLFLYREGKAFQVNGTTGKCSVYEIRYPFRPITSGENSHYAGDEIIGTEPGDGVMLSYFEEHLNSTTFKGEILHTFTATGCLPVSESAYGTYMNTSIHYHRKYYDVITQIEDPSIFNISPACW